MKRLISKTMLASLTAACLLAYSTNYAAPINTSASAIAATVQEGASQPTSPLANTKQEKKIMINLASRILTLYQGDTKIRMYNVGVGKPSTPSPVGTYSVQEKEVNPTWYNPDDLAHPVPSGPDNPLGYRWLGFNGSYGIHGTNVPSSVGHYVSHGCIRLREADIEDLYTHTPLHTPVVVYYDRIVIDRAPDHTISYYIYPDGYNRQPLSISKVKQALAGYGVENFESDMAISDKINASDGQPTYVAKAYDFYVNGIKQNLRALGKNGHIYLPAQTIANTLELDMIWSNENKTITTPYASVPASAHSNVLYIDDQDLDKAFHLIGNLTSNYVYTANRASTVANKEDINVNSNDTATSPTSTKENADSSQETRDNTNKNEAIRAPQTPMIITVSSKED